MIKVGFWYDYGQEYSGGLNYFRNLLYSISQVNDNRIKPYLFIGSDVNQKIIDEFSLYVTVITTDILTKYTVRWFFHRVLFRLFRSQIMVKAELKKYDISVVSHGSMIVKDVLPTRLVTWIPDFQYLHLPEYFPGLDLNKRSVQLKELFDASDVVILSSHSALKDFLSIASNDAIQKGKVLHFASRRSLNNANIVKFSREYLEEKFCFTGKFFFLPNQFWQHKNHIVVAEAVLLLKKKGKFVRVICTGSLDDPWDKDSTTAKKFLKFLKDNDLEEHIKVLGLIELEEVYGFLRNSIALLNPSFFEGWSTSVEEARSINKKSILSNIDVHLEQDPLNAVYFDPKDPAMLSNLMEEVWNKNDSQIASLEIDSFNDQRARIIKFGERYIEILEELQSKS